MTTAVLHIVVQTLLAVATFYLFREIVCEPAAVVGAVVLWTAVRP